MKPNSRGAFTLVELLVVIAIIGVCLALMIPAIQASREAVRRNQCSSQLARLALAMQNYELAQGFYPAGTLAAQGPIQNVPVGFHHGWLVQLLPYLDERNVYLAVDRSASVYAPQNAPVLAQHLSQLYCPSSTTPRSNWSDYAAVHHDLESPIDATNDGVFFLNSRVRYDDITDGLAHTLFMGEKITDAFDMAWMSGTRGTLRNTGFPLNSLRQREEVILPRHASWTVAQPAEPTPPEKLYTPPPPEPTPPEPEPMPETDAPQPTDDSPAESPPTEEELMALLFSEDTLGEPVDQPPPAPLPPSPARQGYGKPLYVGGFGSNHPAGANFAFGDGSVRFLSDSINLATLQTLANRHDGKLPPRF